MKVRFEFFFSELLTLVIKAVVGNICFFGYLPVIMSCFHHSPWFTFIDKKKRDILSMLINARDEENAGLTDHELIGQVFGFLVAGTEVNATEFYLWGFSYQIPF